MKYEKYIHSHAWKEKAKARMEKDHHTCCVCGGEATEVHHLTYENLGNEKPWELVSLCHECHRKAEEIYDPSVIPWAMGEKGSSYMGSLRKDVLRLSPIILNYLMEVRGSDFDTLTSFYKDDCKIMDRVVTALCLKRYSENDKAGGIEMIIPAITNHTKVLCLLKMQDLLTSETKSFPEDLVVLRACMEDACVGIRPCKGFFCLTQEDYDMMNDLADHVTNRD